jgi:hypothetical protein
MMISLSILPGMRYVSGRICREHQNTHFIFDNFFSFENRAVYDMWKNAVQPDRPQTTAQALCMPDNLGYRHTLIIFNIVIAFPRQQCLRERA